MTKIARFPLERRDGPASVTICTCGCPDTGHDAKRYGYPCLSCTGRRMPSGGVMYGPGIKYCHYFQPAGTPAVTALPPQRQLATGVGAFLQRVAEGVLADTYPVRPKLAIVILLNETDSFAEWGHGPISRWVDGGDAKHQIDAMIEHAAAHDEWYRTKPRDKAKEPVQRSARRGRHHRAQVETRMEAIRLKQYPHACGGCRGRFKTPRGLEQHRRLTRRTDCTGGTKR